MRKKVELLREHPDVGTHLVNEVRAMRKLGAIDEDAVLRIFFRMVDAPDQGALAQAGWPAQTSTECIFMFDPYPRTV
jgi:hypothetical protein